MMEKQFQVFVSGVYGRKSQRFAIGISFENVMEISLQGLLPEEPFKQTFCVLKLATETERDSIFCSCQIDGGQISFDDVEKRPQSCESYHRSMNREKQLYLQVIFC